MYHSSKYILDRSIWYTLKRTLVIAIEIIIVAIIVNLIPNIEIINYLTWIIQAIIVFVASAIVVISINSIIYKENVKNIIEIIKNLLNRKVAKIK